MRESDVVNRLLLGALLVGGIAAGGYYVYMLYRREKLKELATGKAQKIVEVPIGGPPPLKRK